MAPEALGRCDLCRFGSTIAVSLVGAVLQPYGFRNPEFFWLGNVPDFKPLTRKKASIGVKKRHSRPAPGLDHTELSSANGCRRPA